MNPIILSTINSRIYRTDIKSFLEEHHQRFVRLFIREVSGTHYTRVYIILTFTENGEEYTWVHEMFSNFSTDWDGRRSSMEIAVSDLADVRAVLEKNGYQVNNGIGEDYHKWRPVETHQWRHYHYEEE